MPIGWKVHARCRVKRSTCVARFIANRNSACKTPKTLAKVKAALAGLPLQLKSGPSTTGLIAILEGAKPGRTVLLRGDMDALPMPEDTERRVRSTVTGAMHACGHDAHTAMLVSARAAACARNASGSPDA